VNALQSKINKIATLSLILAVRKYKLIVERRQLDRFTRTMLMYQISLWLAPTYTCELWSATRQQLSTGSATHSDAWPRAAPWF